MSMDDKKDPLDRGETIPQAKRTGRDGVDPESQPAEFADEMRVNRFTPPPDPPPAKRNR
jgi:hypothetical protein